MKQYIVDAFTDKVFAGNQAAVNGLADDEGTEWKRYGSRTVYIYGNTGRQSFR